DAQGTETVAERDARVGVVAAANHGALRVTRGKYGARADLFPPELAQLGRVDVKDESKTQAGRVLKCSPFRCQFLPEDQAVEPPGEFRVGAGSATRRGICHVVAAQFPPAE